MKQRWSSEELSQYWVLRDDELELLKGKSDLGRVLFGFLLCYYRYYASFPRDLRHLSPEVWAFLCGQLGLSVTLSDFDGPSLARMIRRLSGEVRKFLGIRRLNQSGRDHFLSWALHFLFSDDEAEARRNFRIREWFSENGYELPSAKLLSRLTASAHRHFEERFFKDIVARLDAKQQKALEDLLDSTGGLSGFAFLQGGSGKASLATALKMAEQLDRIAGVKLPDDVLDGYSHALLNKYRMRAGAEDVYQMGRHPRIVRLGLLTVYVALRRGEIVDSLIDALIAITHKISINAEKKVVSQLVREFTKVRGKTTLLFRMAEAADSNPEGHICDIIHPVVSGAVISNLVKEYKSDGPAYNHRVYQKLRASYAQHYRRMMSPMLGALEFQSNLAHCQNLLTALDLIGSPSLSGKRYFDSKDVPIDHVVPNKWRDLLIEGPKRGEARINCISYEICVLHSLRKRLRTKEIWVKSARKYCDPAKDLPQDFENRRADYYARLSLPSNAANFVSKLSDKMQHALEAFDKGLPNNRDVRIRRSNGNPRFSVSPLQALPEPENIEALKNELTNRWGETSLLDVLKEADLCTQFSHSFTSLASRQHLPPDELSRRLILALYGIGTNIGLKPLANLENDVSYKELYYVKQRFLHADNLRQATRKIADATMQLRLPHIWGEASTSCASDSTKVSSWDQNLMTEWHVRYGGRGVMIYWHIDKNSTCIHSQLKKCSSSEVAAMIEGVLHHCTEMEINQHYVDTHGQSVIAFAFCELLGFSLMPRFKGINHQKLVRALPKNQQRYTNIDDMFMQRPINWTLIKEQYDEMVKLATALKERTAEPEAILRRFSREAASHPTYAALIDLGRATKTIFLCEYLGSEKIRREIHSGLNVVERWNGVNNFIYFGKSGEIGSNRFEAQETSVLSLHLLQSAMVYINTIMIQEVLADPDWSNRMTDRDWSALSPLAHRHINPYGRYTLDMSARLPLNVKGIAA